MTRYTGQFDEDALLPVFKAVGAIPTDSIEDEDIQLGLKRSMPRAEAMVRRLELLDGIVGIALEEQKKDSSSIHFKTLHAVAAAGNELLVKLGAINGNAEKVPAQLWNSLRGAVEVSGDSRLDLVQSIAGVAKLVGWVEKAEKIATKRPKRRGRFQRPSSTQLNVLAGDNLWSGDPHNDALKEICNIWHEVLDRKIGTSTSPNNHGKAGGPLIQFSVACFELLGLSELTEAGIRSRIRRIQGIAKNHQDRVMVTR